MKAYKMKQISLRSLPPQGTIWQVNISNVQSDGMI
jgi:hypothetical protein